MEYHRKKKCQKCGSHAVIRKGVKRGASYWYCKSCQCYFSGREKPNKLPLLISIYKGAIHCLKQLKNMVFQFLPYNDISKTYPKVRMFLTEFPPIAITLQMDATYWGRNFGVVIFMDASSHRVLHYRFLRGKERISDYQAGISCLQNQGFTIRAIVSDALSGLKEAFPEIPYQYCQFHQLQRIRHLLTTNPRLPAAKELKALRINLHNPVV